MAVGGIGSMSYEMVPEQPGAFRFYRPDSEQPVLLFGQPAEELASRIDATKAAIEAQPDLRTAETRTQAAPGSRSVRIDRSPTRANVTTTAQTGPAAAPPPNIPTGGAPWAAGLNDWAQPTQPASAQAAPTPAATEGAPRGMQQPAGPGGVRYIGLGIYEDASGRRFKRGGGSPTVTKEMLEKQAGSGVALPSGQAETIEGGFTPSEEYQENLKRFALDEQDRAVDAQILMLERQKQLADLNRQQVAAKAEEQKQELDRQAEIQKRVEGDRAFMEQTRDEYRAKKVDPQRLFRGEGGTARAIGMAIAAGLGAFGATLGRTENFAMNQINAMIDRDISAQEAEIKTLGVTADNALSQLNQSTGDLNQSKALLKALALEYANTQREELIGSIASEQAYQASEQQKIEIEKNLNEQLEKYRLASLGKNTKHVSAQFAYPRRGSAGGLVELTTGEYRADEKARQEGMESAVGVLKTGAEATRTQKETAQGPKLTEAELRYDQQLSTIWKSLQDTVRELGGVIDPETGQVAGIDLPSDIPLVDTAETGKLKARLTKLGTQYANAINAGAEAGQPTKEALTPDVGFISDAGEGQLQAMVTEMLIARKDWDLIKARKAGAVPPEAPVGSGQPVKLTPK